MKYLDYPSLSQLSSSLSDNPIPDVKLKVRIEAYSVKPIGKERKIFKEMEEAYMSEQEEMAEMSFSPEMKAAGLSSCFGRLDEKESRKVHWLLVSTLNSAFPDNDYTSLRPDQFTREPSAIDVVNYITRQLIGPTTQGLPPITMASPPQGSSPLSTSPNPPLANLSMSAILNDIVPFDECEVYSWFPEPEYDPHIQSDDSDESDDGLEELLEEQDGQRDTMADDMDVDEPSWGQGGMELDDVPTSRVEQNGRRRSKADEGMMAPPMQPAKSSDRVRGLLWSANYFFYSRRQKRVLYLTCWCRKRPSTIHSPLDTDVSSMPLPLSASYSGPSNMPEVKPTRQPRRAIGRPMQRRSRPNLRADYTSTIPIRQPETPRAARFASSAPSTYSPLHFTAASPSVAFAKMHAGGFKPKQTPARSQMIAAKEAQEAKEAKEAKEAQDRVRKERSGSTTPGPSTTSGLSDKIKGLVNQPSVVDTSKGKRIKMQS